MQLKEGFILREIAGETVAIPSGDDLDLDLMITLNGTGRFLWDLLEKGAETEDMVSALLGEYNVDADTARQHVGEFVHQLEELNFLV